MSQVTSTDYIAPLTPGKKEFFSVNNAILTKGDTMRIGGKTEKMGYILVKLVYSDSSFERLKLSKEEFLKLTTDLDNSWEIHPSYYREGKGYPLPSIQELPTGSFVIIKEDK